MLNLFERWKNDNDERQDCGWEPLPFDYWYQRELESFERDTKNALRYMSKWKQGTYGRWIYLLSVRLQRPKEEIKEKFIDPFIDQGVIFKEGSYIKFLAQVEHFERVYNIKSLGGEKN